MKMGLFGSGAMMGGALMIGWGMARPRTGNSQVEGPLDAVLLGGGAMFAAGGMAVNAVQGGGNKKK